MNEGDHYFDKPHCRKAISKSICMSCNQSRRLKIINNGSLKKFDLPNQNMRFFFYL